MERNFDDIPLRCQSCPEILDVIQDRRALDNHIARLEGAYLERPSSELMQNIEQTSDQIAINEQRLLGKIALTEGCPGPYLFNFKIQARGGTEEHPGEGMICRSPNYLSNNLS